MYQTLSLYKDYNDKQNVMYNFKGKTELLLYHNTLTKVRVHTYENEDDKHKKWEIIRTGGWD